MSALEQDLDELRELVDGQESWSHRKRLHELENKLRAEELVHAAIEELKRARGIAERSRWARLRDWTTALAAVAAVVVALAALFVKVHHGG